MLKSLALALFLSGCTTVQTACPPLKRYPPEFSARLADEVQAMPDDSAALRTIIDYAQLRDILRACQ